VPLNISLCGGEGLGFLRSDIQSRSCYKWTDIIERAYLRMFFLGIRIFDGIMVKREVASISDLSCGQGIGILPSLGRQVASPRSKKS